VDSCATCHKTDGSGYARFFPELRGNPVTMSPDPVGVIHIVLMGQTLPGFKAAPSSITMPPFGWRLDDQQVADVVTFIRGSWGNAAPHVTADDVRQVRENKTLFPDPRIFGSGNPDNLLTIQR
jgi:mono/diheme cytochrome c family protein